MMLKIVCALVVLSACDSRQNAMSEKGDSIMNSVDKELIDNFNSKILGSWTDSANNNAVFEIRKDSIYYIDQFAAYKYRLRGDSIVIFYPDLKFSGSISFHKDTLIITSIDGSAKFQKFVN
ncbi:hypothetical protein [Hymenobacter sp. HDW8]|uniref:hypothetical protein n=1 Tax=Hymenobacter sp. HDW8 TaxID=2714932 RepID=UPI00140C44E4|nr:hypothetical protein [Hymenobacter sp. HDW8]QIL76320.1 hypothetical protein G7064_10950 [Hymenobacter sp. HDW8]